MSRGLTLLTRSLWSLAGVLVGVGAGLILADGVGRLDGPAPRAAETAAAPQSFILPPEADPSFPMTVAALPPVPIPLAFGPTPGMTPPPAAAPVPLPPPHAAAPPPAPEKPKPTAPKPETKPDPAADQTPPKPAAETILISVADRRLRVTLADGSVRSFPIAVGRSRDLIPIGTTEVVRKRRNPTWVPTPSMRRKDPTLPASVPPGPRNPMGLFALDLGWTYYRIHGTNEPASIGRAASSGCFRMLPKDIEAVFGLVGVGTQVTVIEGRLPKLPEPPPAAPGLPEIKAL